MAKRSLYESVDKLVQDGQIEDAILECEKKLQLHPTNGKLHAYKGMCLYWQKDYAKAEVEFLAAYSLDPNLGEAAVKRAQCLE